MKVGVNLHSLMNNPTDFGSDWDSFNPSHFDEDKVKERNPFSYLPFGGGRRVCIGKWLAYEEMKITLARLLYHFHIKFAPEQMEIVTEFKPPVIQVKDDLKLILTRRDTVMPTSGLVRRRME